MILLRGQAAWVQIQVYQLPGLASFLASCTSLPQLSEANDLSAPRSAGEGWTYRPQNGDDPQQVLTDVTSPWYLFGFTVQPGK